MWEMCVHEINMYTCMLSPPWYVLLCNRTHTVWYVLLPATYTHIYTVLNTAQEEVLHVHFKRNFRNKRTNRFTVSFGLMVVYEHSRGDSQS